MKKHVALYIRNNVQAFIVLIALAAIGSLVVMGVWCQVAHQ